MCHYVITKQIYTRNLFEMNLWCGAVALVFAFGVHRRSPVAGFRGFALRFYLAFGSPKNGSSYCICIPCTQSTSYVYLVRTIFIMRALLQFRCARRAIFRAGSLRDFSPTRHYFFSCSFRPRFFSLFRPGLVAATAECV